MCHVGWVTVVCCKLLAVLRAVSGEARSLWSESQPVQGKAIPENCATWEDSLEDFHSGKMRLGSVPRILVAKLDAGLLIPGLKLFKILESSSLYQRCCLNAATC